MNYKLKSEKLKRVNKIKWRMFGLVGIKTQKMGRSMMDSGN